jgi:CubicO group peptidase (beta-lactamase class C family)
LAILYYTISSNSLTYGQNQTEFTVNQLKKLDSIAIQDVPKSAPGIATGIVSNGKIIYEKVAGFANLKDSTLITKDTRFNIASNGKQFTALTILILAEEKKINLEEDFRKYIPTILPNLKSKITIENLLNHSSGIRDVYDLWSLQGLTWWKESFSNNDALQLIEKQQELNFIPGTKYSYSNTNYILLAIIVEKVTGKSFTEYTDNMFKNLNMPNTSFENNYTNIREPIAKAYFNFTTWQTYDWKWNVCGDGNLFSTLTDQLQWELILQGCVNSKIKRKILDKSQQLTNNETIKNYGYGLEFGNYKGLNYNFHEGATGAWKATVVRFPEKKIAVITLTNTGKCTPDTQTRQMADVVLGIKNDTSTFITKPAKTGNFINEDDIIGIYQTESNFTFQFEKQDGILYLKRNGRNDVKLEREADNIWHQTYDPAFKQEFKVNNKEEMEVTAYYTSHEPYTLTKLNSNWTNFDFSALSGKYLNTETKVTIEIKFINNKNYDIKVGSKDSSKGLLISPTKLLVDNYILEIEETMNIPKVLLLQSNRIQKVKFIRVE